MISATIYLNRGYVVKKNIESLTEGSGLFVVASAVAEAAFLRSIPKISSYVIYVSYALPPGSIGPMKF